jgi:DNA repair protein RecN (Recombination protein N)
MLLCLHIRDLALIEAAEVRVDSGLNVLSGATGGGKSLIVTALKLLRGEKLDGAAQLVRSGARELVVEGEFALGESSRSRAITELIEERLGVRLDPSEESLLVGRAIDANGRSRVRIAGRPATLANLRELGAWLLEIHGQGENRALMRPEIQAETLDAFAGTRAVAAREAFAAALARARAARSRLERADAGARDRNERLEFVRFQLAEIDEAAVEPGEHANLLDEHRLLAHLDAMRDRLEAALAALAEGRDDEATAADLLGRAQRALTDAAGIDSRLQPALESVHAAEDAVADAARAVQDRLSSLDLDPGRLAVVEERLATLDRLLARFGPTDGDLFRRRQALAEELDELEGESAEPEALATALREATAELAQAGGALVAIRRAAAPKLRAAIEGELASLGMAATRIQVEVGEAAGDPSRLLDEATPHGPGAVEFLVRTNPGEPFRALRKTASGGETARIVLAVKKSLAELDRVPFVVFDEIDAEIGGRLGLQVGRTLRAVARHQHQVLIVTHLAQVAAFADAHFLVSKEVVGGRTRSRVTELDAEGRERELAAMASGDADDEAALVQARRMVAKARDDDAPDGRKAGGGAARRARRGSRSSASDTAADAAGDAS